jgi:hypothetical protein
VAKRERERKRQRGRKRESENKQTYFDRFVANPSGNVEQPGTKIEKK